MLVVEDWLVHVSVFVEDGLVHVSVFGVEWRFDDGELSMVSMIVVNDLFQFTGGYMDTKELPARHIKSTESAGILKLSFEFALNF